MIKMVQKDKPTHLVQMVQFKEMVQQAVNALTKENSPADGNSLTIENKPTANIVQSVKMNLSSPNA